MKFNPPKNANYCATVVRIQNLIPLDGCDNIFGTNIFGFQAIVGKHTKIGDVGIFFPVETQLSEDFCFKNSLYRHSEKNEIKAAKGYIEDNRRVRAVKFRGHRSDGFFLSLYSLAYTGINLEELEVGDEFDEINGVQICEKFIVKTKGPSQMPKQEDKFKRFDLRFMPEHFSTDNYFKNAHTIHRDSELILTQKLHGTSVRVGHTIVARKKSLFERICGFLGATIKDTEFDYVFGSRKVIKDVNNPHQNHFYDNGSMDLWTEEGKKLEGLIPENFLVYAEIVGWVGGSPIQKNYTYGYEVGTRGLYVYRVAFVNSQGLVTDLSWDQVKEFCEQRGLNHVPEIGRVEKDKFKPEKFLDIKLKKKFKNCLPVENKDLVDEGICIRVEGLTPRIFKAKSPKFLLHETELLDAGQEDLESQEA